MIFGLDTLSLFLLGLAVAGVVVAFMAKRMDRNAGKTA